MARTVRTKVYKFNELSEQAKQKAIDFYRNANYGSGHNQHYFDEVTDSVKAVIELFNLKIGREYTDIRTSHIDDNILELKGIRLYKYLINNYYNQLFTPTYIKILDRPVKWKQFICKVIKGQSGEYTQIYSKQKRDNSCVLTGICYDMDILDPIYSFLKYPDKNVTFADLMSDIESAISKTYDNTEEWINSDEFIKDEIEANEYEFTQDGKQF